VSKDWKEFRLRDVSFEVKKNEYFMVLGHSGAGKTLLLEVIAGIHEPDEGKIYLNGEDVTEKPPEKRGIAYVPQNYALFPHLSVFDNIAYGLRVRGFERSEIRSTVLDLANVLGIDHLLKRKPKTLSGGEQQRVALARALAVKPKLLLLDEPFSNLDVQTRSKLIGEMKRWRKELGFTAIHVTHNFEEVMTLGDRVGVMVGGKIVQVGCVDGVFSKPENVEVARFLGYNVLDGVLDNGYILINGLKLKSKSDVPKGEVKVVLKPEDVVFSKRVGEYRARVECVEIFRLFAKVLLNVQGVRIFALTTAHRVFDEGIKEGDDVFVSIRDFLVF